MAWFKSRAKTAEPTPVDFVRIMRAVEDIGYRMTKDPERPVADALFNGFPVRIHAAEESQIVVLTVQGAAGNLSDNPRGLGSWQEAWQWANDWNARTLYGTAWVMGEEGDSPEDQYVMIDVSIPVGPGLSDEQLQDWLQMAFSCVVQGCESFQNQDED